MPRSVGCRTMSVADVTIDQLTKSQAARRQRVISSALELATEGGYDAVQMRDVAARANVALGTIYRYFGGKDHILAAARVEWSAEPERQVPADPPWRGTVAERMAAILRRAADTMEGEPLLT